MGQLTNLYVSQSYQGLLKMTDSTNGLTNTLQTVQTGDGDNSPLQMSLTEVNISGSFSINNVPITNGTSGTSGTSGVNGTSGSSGTSGASGSSGSGGTSGTSGSSGSSGTSGQNGSSGTSGVSGTSGTSGSDGSSGTSGTSGQNGSSGTSGVDGSSGTSGSSGSSGTSGSSGISGSSGTSGDSLFALTGSVWNTTNNVGITGSINISGSATLANFTPLVFGTLSNGSIVSNGAGDINLTPKDGSRVRMIGNTIVTGSLTAASSSLQLLSNNTTNFSSNLSFADGGTSNIIQGWGDNPNSAGPGALQSNYTGSLRITGSNNIVQMPQIRSVAIGGQADQQGYISGSGNILLSNFSGIFLNTGSLLLPKTQGNIIGNGSSINMNFTTSSIAGGHPTIGNNLVLGGAISILHNSGSLTSNTNAVLGGNINSTQNFTTNVRPSISQNNVIGSVVLNHISSSILFNANYTNATLLNVNNHLSSSIVNNQLTVANNAFVGGNGGALGIYVSGSQSSNVARNITNNLIGGQSNVVSSSFVSSSVSNLNATIIYGSNLTVSGSHVSLGGSAFFGRFNDTGSNLASAQEVVFAVGTGTGASGRKTGFLVDSGSFTRISGSLSVQGGSSLTGSLNINGGPLNSLVVTGSANIQHSIAGQPTLTLSSTLGTGQSALVASGSISVLGDVLFASGSDKTMGTFVLNGGNPGTATVLNTLVTANSLIFLTKQTNANSGNGTVSVTSKGTGTFSVTSNHNGDTDTVAYLIINPA